MSPLPPQPVCHRSVGRLARLALGLSYSVPRSATAGSLTITSANQIEYSRNVIFDVGGDMEQVFQALIDRSRAPLDLKTIKTILGYKPVRDIAGAPSARPNGKSRSRDLAMI